MAGRSNQAMFALVCQYPCGCMADKDKRRAEMPPVDGPAVKPDEHVRVLGVFKVPKKDEPPSSIKG